MKALTISEAAQALQSGELVVVPTETVYGLAADATQRDAVLKIFAAKGRPANHPLILHAASAEKLAEFVEMTDDAKRLFGAFSPGPLTLVLHRRSAAICTEVSAGRPTLAVRIPAHETLLSILREGDLVVAAPSANRFTMLSPTETRFLDPEILKQVAGFVEGGPCEIGIESTILDLTRTPYRILRLGHISAPEIEQILGSPVQVESGAEVLAPGMHPVHYRPRTPVYLKDRLEPGDAGIVRQHAAATQIELPNEPIGFANRLYAALAELDQQGHAALFIEALPEGAEWAAVKDRVERLALKH